MTAEYVDVFEIPTNGGRREGAGRKKGYSPKLAAEIIGGSDPSGATETTRVTADFAIARARNEAAKADMNELEFKIKSGEYVSRAAVQQASATMLATVSQTLRSISDNLERRGVPAEVCVQVEAAVNETLAEAAQTLQMLTDDQ